MFLFGASRDPVTNIPASGSPKLTSFTLATVDLRSANLRLTNHRIRLRFSWVKISRRKFFTSLVSPKNCFKSSAAGRLDLEVLPDAYWRCFAPPSHFHACWITKILIGISAAFPPPNSRFLLRSRHVLPFPLSYCIPQYCHLLAIHATVDCRFVSAILFKSFWFLADKSNQQQPNQSCLNFRFDT